MNFHIALSCLLDSRHRNLMALAGLVVGVAAIVAMLTLTQIVRREALTQFQGTGMNVMAIRATGGVTSQQARAAPHLTIASVMPLNQAVAGIENIAPVMMTRTDFTIDGRTYSVPTLGVSESFSVLNTMPIATGRGLSDLDRFQPYAVIGHELAATLADGASVSSMLGREIVIEGRIVKIVGILGEARAIRPHGGDLNKTAFLPITTYSRLFQSDSIATVYVSTVPGTDPGKVSREITAWFEKRVEGLGIQITSARETLAEMERQLQLFTVFLGAVGALAFLLGGAGMINSLNIAMADRRSEIGLRRALGALRGDIHAQFLYESLLLCGIGGLIGVGAGVAVTAGIARFADWTFAVSPIVMFAGVVISLGIGLVAGSVPAWQAARLDPSTAMKAGE